MNGLQCVVPGCLRDVAHSRTCYCSRQCNDDDDGGKYALRKGLYFCNGAHGPVWEGGLHAVENEAGGESPVVGRMRGEAAEIWDGLEEGGEEVEEEEEENAGAELQLRNPKESAVNDANGDIFQRFAKKPRNADAQSDAFTELGNHDDCGDDDGGEWLVSGKPTGQARRQENHASSSASLAKYKTTTTQQSGKQTSLLAFMGRDK